MFSWLNNWLHLSTRCHHLAESNVTEWLALLPRMCWTCPLPVRLREPYCFITFLYITMAMLVTVCDVHVICNAKLCNSMWSAKENDPICSKLSAHRLKARYCPVISWKWSVVFWCSVNLQQRHLHGSVRMYDIALHCVLCLSPLHHCTPMKCAIITPCAIAQ